MQALLCLGIWSQLKLVEDDNVKKVSGMQDIEGKREIDLEDGWDRITIQE